MRLPCLCQTANLHNQSRWNQPQFFEKQPKNEVYKVKVFWSPANSSIAYYYNKLGDLAGEQQDIYLLGFNRETAKNLTQKTRNCDELSWSPDDPFIAFVAGELNNQKLYTINANGDQECLDGIRHVIYPWNQSKI